MAIFQRQRGPLLCEDVKDYEQGKVAIEPAIPDDSVCIMSTLDEALEHLQVR